MRMRRTILVWCAAAAICSVGCGDDDDAVHGDGGHDGGVQDELPLAGLECPVEVVTDVRGVPHIYACTLTDAVTAQGYVMARDRIGQMAFLRLAIAGRLSELFGSVNPDVIDLDIAARAVGHVRMARAKHDALEEGSDEKAVLDAFAAGVNAHIARLRAGDAELPIGVASVFDVENIEDWHPVDSLSLIQYIAWDQSYKRADRELMWTRALVGSEEAFPADAADPQLAARADVFHDLFSFLPGENVPSIGEAAGGTTAALRVPDGGSLTLPARHLPTVERMDAARRFFELLDRHAALAGPDPGSNNWAVHGTRTRSGNPLLASDPHLSLASPPLFWMVHIDTTKMGGDVDVQGIALAGVPLVVMGATQHVAWGMTNAFIDVADVYSESITPGTGSDADTALYDGGQRPVERITEVIRTDVGEEHEVTFERVGGRWLIPEIQDGATVARTGSEALSVRWTGHEVTNEAAALVELVRARNVEDVRTSLASVGSPPFSFMFVTRDGDIFWTTQSYVPTRAAGALTYDPSTREGHSPCMVLPGTSSDFDWTGWVSDADLPQDLNPARGFLATANQDLLGTTADGDPHDDPVFIHCHPLPGYRMARLVERLGELTARGDVTVEEMQELQGDHVSVLARHIVPPILDSLRRALAEHDTPGTHPDLSGAVAAAGDLRMEQVRRARARLAEWSSFRTPSGVDDESSPADGADSIAASIAIATRVHLIELAFADELDRIGAGRHWLEPALQRALIEPEKMGTYDAAVGDTILWDDLDTDDVVETRDERILAATLDAIAELEARLGTDMFVWRWGLLHTLTLKSLLPMAGRDVLSIPPDDAAMWPDGFPRHGESYTVDSAYIGGLQDDGTIEFRTNHGAQQRFVVEMTPHGPRAWNALPGGQSENPNSPHRADEMELWRHNEAPELLFDEALIRESAERTERLVPR